LGEYLLAHPRFPALRSLRLDGKREDLNEMGEVMELPLQQLAPYQLTGVLQALGQGHAPALETLALRDWHVDMGSVAALGPVIGEGKLPALSALELKRCGFRSADFRAIVDGLVAGPGQLRCLLFSCPLGSPFSDGDAQHLGSALKTGGGGLGQLEDLGLMLPSGWVSVLDGLVGGAPCARTPRAIYVKRAHGGRGGEFDTLVKGLGAGAFPHLAKLVLHTEARPPLMCELVEAFVSLKAKGTPSCLAELRFVCGPYKFDTRCFERLTPVFDMGALPHLKILELGQLKRPNYYDVYDDNYFPEITAAGFIRDWTRFGPKIKLERLGFPAAFEGYNFGWTGGVDDFLAALANPAFCPFLIDLAKDGWVCWSCESDAALEKRRQKKREAQERAAM
jgi:hypothetical protein